MYSSSSFANFGGANGGTSKEDTHPLFWAQAHLFHPLSLLSIPRWTRCAAAMLVSGGPGRGDIAVVHVATLVAALLDISRRFLVPGEAPSGVVKSGGSISQERLRHGAL